MITQIGVYQSIQRLKQIRLLVTRYMCGDPMLTNPFNIRTDKKGIPSILRSLKSYVDSQDPKDTRFLLTLLMFSRCISGGHQPIDLDPITKPTAFKLTEDLKRDIETVIKT
jgi:hypothetical protein